MRHFLLTSPHLKRVSAAPMSAPSSSSHLSSLASSSAVLRPWHSAVAAVPLSALLPIGLGGATNSANISAFFGDKIIGAQVARAQNSKLAGGLNLKDLTSVQSLAVSNEIFCENLVALLPAHVDAELAARAAGQQHDCGTMVEAAVFACAQLGDRETAEAAIAGLAEWLVFLARDRLSSKSSDIVNAKGLLCESGGSVTSERLLEFPDHSPQFRAVATLGTGRMSESATATGPNKKESEQSAARLLFSKLDTDAELLPPALRALNQPDAAPRQRVLPPPVAFAPAAAGWTEVGPQDLAANLQCGEPLPEWWARESLVKGNAFNCMYMGPKCFPSAVLQVNAWLSPADNRGFHAIGAVKISPPSPGGVAYVEVRSVMGVSKDNTKGLLGVAINKIISERCILNKVRHELG